MRSGCLFVFIGWFVCRITQKVVDGLIRLHWAKFPANIEIIKFWTSVPLEKGVPRGKISGWRFRNGWHCSRATTFCM